MAHMPWHVMLSVGWVSYDMTATCNVIFLSLFFSFARGEEGGKEEEGQGGLGVKKTRGLVFRLVFVQKEGLLSLSVARAAGLAQR